MVLLDGKKVRDKIAAELRQRIAAFRSKPKLVIIQIGENEASTTYIAQKKRFGENIGALVEHKRLAGDSSESALLATIAHYNAERTVHGVIVQMPIPEHLDRDRVVDAIAAEKDVDGLGSASVKALWENKRGAFIPATTKGILSLLTHYNIAVRGKRAVVVGRSYLVGKPTALALLNADATVTVAHSKTENLPQITRAGDILIVAAGKPHFINREYVREGQVVVDVGITSVDGVKLQDEVGLNRSSRLVGRTNLRKFVLGDVDFEEVKNIVAAISPVPGGVGPMTVASLFENLVAAYERQKE